MALLPSSQDDQRKLLIGLVPVLLVFMYWYFYHGDFVAEVEQLETRLEQLESQNRRARGMAARAGPELEERLALYEERMDRLERLIPSTEEVAELIHTMNVRAQETDVDLAMIRPQPEQRGQFYIRQTRELRVLGDYHDIGRFLTAVGSLQRIVKPIDLDLRQPEARGGGTTKTVQASFRVETYVLPERTAPAEGGGDAET